MKAGDNLFLFSYYYTIGGVFIKPLRQIFPYDCRDIPREALIPHLTALFPDHAGFFSVTLFNSKIILEKNFSEGEPAGIAAENCMSGRSFARAYMWLEDRCPTWPEMVALNHLLFHTDDIPTFQVHPRADQYVNNHPFALHIWKPEKDFFSHIVLASMKSETEQVLMRFENSEIPTSRQIVPGEIHGKKYIAIWGGDTWPTWAEVCQIKRDQFGNDVTALQFHISPEVDLNAKRILLLWEVNNFLGIQLPTMDMV